MFSHTVFLPLELLRIGVTAGLYFLSIWGWGCLVSRACQNPERSFPEYIASRVLTGCFSLYLAFILIGSIGYLRPGLIRSICAAGLLLFLLHVQHTATRLRAALHEVTTWQFQERVLLAFVCCLAILQIACAFTPLTFYDSQVYQLLAPVQFLSAGRFVHIPWNVLTNGPQALQVTLGMSWIADGTGSSFKVLMALIGCLSILAAARIGSEFGIRAAMTSALFVVAYPEFWIHETFGVVDLGAAAFLLFGVMWWMDSLRQKDWNRTILAGIAFGFVAGSRYQGVVLIVWMVLGVLVAHALENREVIADGIRKVVAMAGITTLMTLPWLIRNYSNFHNPVYPLLHGVLGGGEWSPQQAVLLRNEVMGRSLGMLSGSDLLLAPFRALLMFPSNGLFGLVMLIGGIVVACSKTSKRLPLYAVLGLGGILIWGLIHPTSGVELLRFNSASLVLLLACTGTLFAGKHSKRVYAALALSLTSIVIAFFSVNSLVPVWRVLTNANSRMELWRGNVPSWQALDVANAKLDPAHDKVLLIGETRAVWLKVPFLAPSALNGPQLLELFSPGAGPMEWTRRLHQLGITHMLICSSEWQRLADSAGYFRLSDTHLNVFLSWLHTLPVVFDDHRGNVLLAL